MNSSPDPISALLHQAQAAPLPAVDLERVHQRLHDNQPSRTGAARPVASLIAVLVLLTVGSFVERFGKTPSLPALPALPADTAYTQPHFHIERMVRPQMTRVTRPRPAETPLNPSAASDESRSSPSRSAVRPRAPASELALEAAASDAPHHTVKASGRHPVTAYQPRAIREMLRVDWPRWKNRDLPRAVARMIQARDPVGLLAALDDLPLTPSEPNLLMLRGQLRVQARRCEDARTDFIAADTDAPPCARP